MNSKNVHENTGKCLKIIKNVPKISKLFLKMFADLKIFMYFRKCSSKQENVRIKYCSNFF